VPPISELHLDVHGLTIGIGGWPEVVDDLRLDFAWFERRSPAAGAAQLRIAIERRPPDFAGLPDVPTILVTPRNAVYQDGERTVVDYTGRALAILDRRSRTLVVQSEERHLVHEVVYLFTLSQTGEHLDAQGLTRLHALGLVGHEGAVAVLLPSGGGKSTLALRALREPGVRLLSDDSPLLDRRGRAHPFPLRIGIGREAARALPPDQVRRIERLEYPVKYVVSIDAFRAQIEREPQPLAHIVVARRRLGTNATLRTQSRGAVVGPLFREGVVGLGLAQMIEWVLQRGPRDALGKVGIAARRAACCASATSRAQTWQLDIGRDDDRNWKALAPLLL
jgi:hypothetical protein